MATREDVILDFAPEPRIAVVESPSLEFTIQDIVDTLRKREDSFQGQGYSKLINASGKEDLGGGVAVGITAELQNTQIAFEGRTDPAQTGTVTTASIAPVGNSRARASGLIRLHDTAALFISNNITRGSLVVNFTDQSIAEVYDVVSEIELITRTLVNGIDNSFDISDAYHIFNIVQCEVIGGNILGVDAIGGIISPITPTAFTQVLRTGSSSATLVSQTTLEHAAFDNVVTYDAINGVAGTNYPTGTGFLPSNNLTDAKIIAVTNNLRRIHVIGDFTGGATDNIDKLIMIGDGLETSSFDFVAGCSTNETTFITADLTGDLSGAITAHFCSLRNLSGIGSTTSHSNILECVIESGTITISASNTQKIHVSRCESGAAGISAPPTLNVNGSIGDITIHKYAGSMQFSNMSAANQMTFDTSGGAVTLNPSCAAGTITIGGTYELDDNSTGTTVIRNTNLDIIEFKVDNIQTDVDAIEVTLANVSTVIDDLIKYQRNKSVIDPTAFTLTIYEDDGTTPLKVFDLKDSAGVASITSIFQRIPL